MRRKIITVILIVCVMMLMTPCTAFASGKALTVKTAVDKTTATLGDTVTITVKVSGSGKDMPVAALGFELGMPSGYEIVSYEIPYRKDFNMCDFNSDINRFTAFGADGITDSSWNVLIVKYKITGDAVEGSHEITVKNNDILAACNKMSDPYELSIVGANMSITGTSGKLTPGTTEGKGVVPPVLIIIPNENEENEQQDISAEEQNQQEIKAKNDKTINAVKNTKITAKISKAKNGLKVTWTKSKYNGTSYKVDYYQVYRSTKKSSEFKKVYTTKSGTAKSYTNSKNLKKGKTYYYKVRGVRKIAGKNYYTKWSNKVSKKW